MMRALGPRGRGHSPQTGGRRSLALFKCRQSNFCPPYFARPRLAGASGQMTEREAGTDDCPAGGWTSYGAWRGEFMWRSVAVSSCGPDSLTP